ncbi:MAG: tyrosine-type recombinase/integrase [Oscillatoriaceae cyanobacterium Prado104]|nr:tyrosine-type recombinase/integrase [Oscillatoriaceae cyanobacterium Prado104]
MTKKIAPEKNGVVEKYGKISIERRGDSYKIRWSCGGRQYSRSIGKAAPEILKVARGKAQEINSDILLERFDPTLEKYFSAITPAPLDLLTLWQQYKVAKRKLTAPTTQKGDWPEVDRALAAVDRQALKLTNSASRLLLAELLDKYSASTTRKVLTYIRASALLAVEDEEISQKEANYYCRLFKSIPKSQKSSRSRKCFERHEIKAIIEAFQSDEFNSKYSNYTHSYYAGYVEFLTLTGFRPEEAIALTWDNIKNNEIVVCKAYSQGILKSTKTYETRSFPVNAQLNKLLTSLPKDANCDLIFPSPDGGHINQNNFNKRYWLPIVKQLVSTGKVQEYLPTNNLRHSWITRMLRAGLDIATVARLAGNKPDTIMKHYLAAKTQDLVLPEF